jgi:hypothetical protein
MSTLEKTENNTKCSCLSITFNDIFELFGLKLMKNGSLKMLYLLQVHQANFLIYVISQSYICCDEVVIVIYYEHEHNSPFSE